MRALLLLLLCASSAAFASWRDAFSLRGYVRETPIVWKLPSYDSSSGGRRFDNLLHTRQNLRWFPAPPLRFGLELKTRLFLGESARQMRALADLPLAVQPYFRLTRTFVNEKHVLLTSTLDRAWLDCTSGQVEITLGRQRIAWGTNWVWNPTDIFNPASPLDFDNEEKPGTDAARAQWYWGPSAVLDAAVAPQREADSMVAAVRLKLNLWEYDWALSAGRRGPVSLTGFAWAGQIAGGGFRGEVLASMPRDTGEDHRVSCLAAVSGDYTFRSSLYVHSEVLYNQRGTTGAAGGYHLLSPAAYENLSPARWSLFGEIARDLSPLVRVDLNGILDPNDQSWYAGPSLIWSVRTNLDFTAAALIFGGKSGTEFGDASELLMARLKFSF
jgi:hypothetical protein